MEEMRFLHKCGCTVVARPIDDFDAEAGLLRNAAWCTGCASVVNIAECKVRVNHNVYRVRLGRVVPELAWRIPLMDFYFRFGFGPA